MHTLCNTPRSSSSRRISRSWIGHHNLPTCHGYNQYGLMWQWGFTIGQTSQLKPVLRQSMRSGTTSPIVFTTLTTMQLGASCKLALRLKVATPTTRQSCSFSGVYTSYCVNGEQKVSFALFRGYFALPSIDIRGNGVIYRCYSRLHPPLMENRRRPDLHF
jgi:hypothetical protein